MTEPSVLVLQHIACEPPALFEDVLRARGVELTRVEVDEGEPIPELRDFAAVIAMGGPMGAYEDERLPWLVAEKAAIRRAVEAGVPFWGVCLGAQLLAAALGARVYRGAEPEVGVSPVRITAAGASDPVFGGLPPEFPSLQWHGDTFDLPAGAVLLAESDAYPHQAFVVGRAYGLQFHLEVTPGLAAQWAAVPEYAASLEAVKGPGAAEDLLEAITRSAGETAALAMPLFERWLDEVVAPAASVGPA
ncbi:type 1 glutamine amidotransferase [Pseudonocardia spinosispora]|uniref:type 1 glutamine amidotransferase n=1 Tax=Pseudonocardia spinosispora TaxID=103441 RepID=UPI0004245DE9|nr:type 1 glutamine amidotransferase [Pseudonocardia spinosispora]